MPLVVVILAVGALPCVAEQPASPRSYWFRGNTHAHTINSDGNSAPDTVVRWYRENGYQFVVITDHDYITNVAPLNALYGRAPDNNWPGFLVMTGEEVTQRFPDRRQAHVNAINLKKLVLPIGSSLGSQTAPPDLTMPESFKRNVAAIIEAGGLAQINHPNYRWSVRPDDLLGLPSPLLLEIWNAGEHNMGGIDDGGNRGLSTSELWDVLLSRGQIVWGVASDDAHDFINLDKFTAARPGRAWVMVRAEALTPEAITGALTRGDFYSTFGITLSGLRASETEVAIEIEQDRDCRYLTRFIGKSGRLLAEVPGLKPRYAINGDEGYVRAEIRSSKNIMAWTQPVFVRKSK